MVLGLGEYGFIRWLSEIKLQFMRYSALSDN